jgi:hypothetical protein
MKKIHFHQSLTANNSFVSIVKYIGSVVFLLLISVKTLAQTEAKTRIPKIAVTIGSGYAFQNKNRVQQPSERGTSLRFDKFTTSAPVALRLQVNYKVDENKEYRLLISPFSQKGSFTASNKVLSEGTEFSDGEKIDTYFGFNSIRFGFANKISQGTFKNFKIGVTLVVRKWEVSLKSATKTSENDNWLALPLLFVGYEKNISPKLVFTTELDVLGFPNAYVLEGGSALNYQLSNNFQFGLQYRIISGAYISSDIKNLFTAQNIGLALTTKF